MMNSNENLTLITFTDTTKKICTCSSMSIFLIVLFIISPLSKFFLTSIFMRIIILALLFYTIYLNIIQTNYLRNMNKKSVSKELSSQLSMNILCSYVFTLFIGLLIIFVVKSFI